MENNIENLINQDYLKDTMTFISLYTMTYESMVDYVVSQIHDHLCDMSVEEGKLHFIETPEYRAQIKNKRVDEKGNKDITKASFLWLKDNNAITEEDYKSNFNLLLEHSMLGATRVNPVTVSIDDMKQMLDAVYYGRKIDF